MASIHASLYTVALALCVFSTGILSGRRTRTGRPMAFFIGYLGIESVGFALELLAGHPAVPLMPLWLSLLMASSLLTAPCLWLAIREAVTGERPDLRQLHPGHGLVILAGALLCLPLMAAAFPGPAEADRPWHFVYIHDTMIACIAIFSVQVPYYLKRSRRLLEEHAAAAGLTTLPQRAWLHLPLLVVGTTWALGMMRVVQCAARAPAEFVLLFAFIDVSVTAGALYLILRRAFFVPSPAPVELAPAAVPASDAAPKYAKSRLNAAFAARIGRKLHDAFEQDHLHRDSDLSLRSLSAHLREKPHYVSQVINQELATNFFDLVNRHRIEDAQRLLRENPDQTVLDIALAVGFNAKSTFNTAFKRHTGATPRDYRTRHSGQ